MSGLIRNRVSMLTTFALQRGCAPVSVCAPALSANRSMATLLRQRTAMVGGGSACTNVGGGLFARELSTTRGIQASNQGTANTGDAPNTSESKAPSERDATKTGSTHDKDQQSMKSQQEHSSSSSSSNIPGMPKPQGDTNTIIDRDSTAAGMKEGEKLYPDNGGQKNAGGPGQQQQQQHDDKKMQQQGHDDKKQSMSSSSVKQPGSQGGHESQTPQSEKAGAKPHGASPKEGAKKMEEQTQK